ncbi:MAG: hypothetical protein RJQ14_24035, partial [Marinoscillum sp.]
ATGLLQVENAGTGDASIRFDVPGNNTVLGIDQTESNTFKINMGSILTDGVADFAISPTGDVGIGTSTPGSKLDVNGSANIVNDAIVGNLISVPGTFNNAAGTISADSRTIVLTGNGSVTDINVTSDGKEIILIGGGGGTTTVSTGGNIRLNTTGANPDPNNFDLVSGSSLHLVYIESLLTWVEISRSI